MHHLAIPSGYLVDNHSIFGDASNGCVLAKTWAVEFPDTRAADEETFIELERDQRLMLGCTKPDERIQLSYYTGNDYESSVSRFEGLSASCNGISHRVRDELVGRYRNRIAKETLIRSSARLSISTKLPKFFKEEGKTVRGFQDVFKVVERSFSQRGRFFDLLLQNYGGSVTPLCNAENYADLLRFWSPGQLRAGITVEPDWMRPIEDLCRFSGLSPRHEPHHGFYMDGYHFGLLVAKTMPRGTWYGTMHPFLALSIPNLRVTLNMRALSVEKEIQHEAERFEKLGSNVTGVDADLRSIVGMEKHRDRMRGLMSNKVIPYKTQLIVTACERSADKLDERMEGLRAALGKCGCESFQPALASSTIAFFNAATPGYGPWVDYPDYWHKMDDAVNVANMWPVGSTPEADLKTADWITDGDCENLIGGRCFTGDQPDHAMVAGSTGYGKSSLIQSLAIQTAPQFKFIVVIDDGLSWMTTCNKLDSSSCPIMLRADSDLTFNVLDTLRLPLTGAHLANATALSHLIVGVSSDPDRDKLRHAILADAINNLYSSAFRKWRNAHPTEHYDLCRKAANIVHLQQERNLETFLDAFLEYKGIEPKEATPVPSDPDDDIDPDDFGRNPKTEHIVRNLAFAYWTPEMFPTLSDLQDELHSLSMQKGPDAELCSTLARLLRPWLRDGLYGGIIDGVGNIDLGSVDISESDPLKVVHFELGEISKANTELRAVVGFLITNQVRNHIQGMPRGIRKQVVIEEMISFLKVPNGAEIVMDYYERMRKYSCQVISVFQSYSTLLEASPKVAKAIVSNSSVIFLLGNRNRSDIETLSSYLPKPGIPIVIKDAIGRFPKPAEIKRDAAYAGFVYVQLNSEKPRYTIGRNYVSDEVEQITSSSGSDFEKKRKELREQNG